MEVTGNLPVRSVAIRSWGLMILVKTWLEHVSNIYIGYTVFGGMLSVLVKFMFSLICFMCNFDVAMEGGRCLMSFTVMLGQVVKWPFLMARSKVFFTGLKRATWYHLARSGLRLAARALSAAGYCLIDGPVGLLVRLTCPIPDMDDLLPSSTVSPYLTTLR